MEQYEFDCYWYQELRACHSIHCMYSMIIQPQLTAAVQCPMYCHNTARSMLPHLMAACILKTLGRVPIFPHEGYFSVFKMEAAVVVPIYKYI
jgi:hypothetical protein